MPQQLVSLPYDIWETIFCFIEDTKDIDGQTMSHTTLARCCLINRALLQVAQSILFRHYILTFRTGRRQRFSIAQRFSGRPDLQRYVRRLTVRIDPLSLLDLLGPYRAESLVESLPFATPPRIRCDLSGLSWSALPQDIQHFLTRLLSSPDVTDATIIGRMRVCVPGTLFTHIRHIKRFTLVDLLLEKDPEGAEHLESILEGVSLPQLTYLSMAIHNSRSLLLFGKLTKAAPNLRTVQFKVEWPPSFASGSLLENSPPDYVAAMVPVNCRSLTNFEITLSHISFDHEKANPAMCGPLRKLLQVMPASMEFRLALDADEITFFGHYPGWKAVDEMLVDLTNSQPNRMVYFRFRIRLRSKTAILKEERVYLFSRGVLEGPLFPMYFSAIKHRLSITRLSDINDPQSTTLVLETSGY